jgi:multidrug transporter EmrE-like cation transporter
MKLLLAMLPTIVFTAYSQLIIRWRVTALAAASAQSLGIPGRTFAYLLDPFVISAYFVTFLSAINWWFVLEKHPVSIAFPVYIGVLFCVVTLGSALWLKESITIQHLVGLALILVGVAVVSRAA